MHTACAACSVQTRSAGITDWPEGGARQAQVSVLERDIGPRAGIRHLGWMGDEREV
jgi:hypothetical protein